MGLMGQIFATLFGDGRNVLRDTAEVFRENAEAAGSREASLKQAALHQMAAEFRPTRHWFDTLMDGINRLPRPMLALGTLGLFAAAMVDPIWFAQRMQGLALVPEALWWLMGAVVSFYFGARHQVKGQQFQRDIAQTLAQTLTQVPMVIDNSRALEELAQSPAARGHVTEPSVPADQSQSNAPGPISAQINAQNPALDAWRALRNA